MPSLPVKRDPKDKRPLAKIPCEDGRRRIPYHGSPPKGGPLVLDDGSKVCGAKTKDRHLGLCWACGDPAVSHNGRCKRHGGRGSGRPVVHGQRSKFIPTSWAQGFEESQADKAYARTLEHELHVINGALDDGLRKIRAGCSDEQIARAKELFDQATLTQNTEALRDLGKLLDQIEVDPEAKESYFRDVERKVKIVEAMDRQDARILSTINEREMRTTVSLLMATIIEVVHDESVSRNLIPNVVGARFARHFGRPVGGGADQ